MSQRRSYIAAAQVGPLLYAAGGMVGETGRPLATFTRYDRAAIAGRRCRRCRRRRAQPPRRRVGGVVYVVGGTTPDGNTRAVWAWDGSRWRARAPLPVPRFNHSAVALDGRIYVLGGYRRRARARDVFVYDPQRGPLVGARRRCRGRRTPSAPSRSAARSG